MRITQYTRIRGASGNIFIHKILNHRTTEFLPDVQDIMRKAVMHRSLASIIKRVDITAAGLLLTSAGTIIVPGFHSDSYYLISLMMKH
ncbi:hypothetical protein D3C86_1383040 [compost metagenome]